VGHGSLLPGHRRFHDRREGAADRREGRVAASATTALPSQTPKPLWSEQDPREWWNGTAASVRKALADAGATGDDVAAIGLTGQMHGLVLLDKETRGPAPRHPLERPADRRGVRRDRAARREGELIREVGNVALTGFTAPKILWVRNHEPEVYAKGEARAAAEGLRPLRLTGEAAMDKADGSRARSSSS
jgi:xylulokinase